SIISLTHRDMSAETGRHRSPDPAEDKLNPYPYASNNPVNRADPSGLADEYIPRRLVLIPRRGNASSHFELKTDAEIEAMRKGLLTVNPATGQPFPIQFPIELFPTPAEGLSAAYSNPTREGAGNYILVNGQPWELTAAERQSLLDASDRSAVYGPTATLLLGASTLDEVVTGIATGAQQYRNLRSRDQGALSRSNLSDVDFRKMQAALSYEAINAEVAPIQRAVSSWSAIAGGVGTAVRGINVLKPGVIASDKFILRSADDLLGVERATPELLDTMRRHGRRITIATEGSDELRMLDYFGAEASVGGEDMMSIILRPNPSKAAVLEEFLHGTQHQIGIIDKLGRTGLGSAETHVKDFMIRHQKLLGLSKEDVRILQILRDKGL
ncbi:MAG TPA: RHS repeat-associated core domain-containing protein, partial [Planctomicrobium sp.]|nr:RHS repeat-associated core domain-containing protein [Planctomicrobium sp.]